VVGDKKSTARGTKAKRIAAAKKPVAREHVGPETRAVVTINRRDNRMDRRKAADRRVRQIPVAIDRRVGERRAKVSRRRQIDPTTCERDYTLEEVEFMSAMDNYKRRSGRMFPTCSEVLEVIRSLGYAKQVQTAPVVLPGITVSAAPIDAAMVVGS
jgi:hypothetical protein